MSVQVEGLIGIFGGVTIALIAWCTQKYGLMSTFLLSAARVAGKDRGSSKSGDSGMTRSDTDVLARIISIGMYAVSIGAIWSGVAALL